MNKQQVKNLVILLLDKSARIDERDDAAMELYLSDDLEALDALIKVGSDESENFLILSSTGESIGEILSRKSNLDINILKKLNETALHEALAIIKSKKPEWNFRYDLEHFH